MGTYILRSVGSIGLSFEQEQFPRHVPTIKKMDTVFLLQSLKGKVQLPVSNATVFAEILDAYCRQQQLETRFYSLQRERNGKVVKIDLSGTWGMSGLPSKAELEVVKRDSTELGEQGKLK